MATHSNTNGLKARRILNIKKAAIGKYTNFFDLPRELRNMIYEYALVERSLWHRRHQLGCPFRDPLGTSEEPVFHTTLVDYERNERMTEVQRRRPSWGQPPFKETLTLDRVSRCKQLCQGRPGLVLLRTSKRTYKEAKRLFWTKNLICFFGAKLFLEACRELPRTIRGSIRRLSIAENGQVDWRECEGELWTRLESLCNLVELELPPDALWWHGDKLISCTQLSAARAINFENVSVRMTSGDAEVVVQMSIDIPIPSCFLQGHTPTLGGVSNRKEKRHCYECWYQLLSAERRFRSDVLWDRLSSFARFVADLFQGDVPAYSGKAPMVVKSPVPLPLEVEWDIGLLGLPLKSSKMRERLLVEEKHKDTKTMRARCSNENRVRKQEGSVFAIEDADSVVAPQTRKHRLDYGKRDVREETTRAKVVAERREKLDLLEKRESANRKKAALETLERGMKELSLEKKAARKRVGKMPSK